MLRVTNLKKYFPVGYGFFRPTQWLKAVDGISFDVHPGETLGVVGESGSGKSTVAKLIIRLHDPTSGAIELNGRDLTRLSGQALRQARRDVQMVFQDPYSSLNPRWTVGQSLTEPMKALALHPAAEQRERVQDLLNRVGLSPSTVARYPHEFSGGQRQRIGIARALVLHPKVILLDEPVSALDISVQAQIINLLQDLQEQLHLTYLFISHDLSVVEHVSTRVAVMYLGHIVEIAPTATLVKNPAHPYTQALLSAIPRVEGRSKSRIVLTGDIPSPVSPPQGCPFHTRCPVAMDVCRAVAPAFKEVGQGHTVACHLH